MAKLPQFYRTFQREYGDLAQAYEALGATAAQSGPLDPQTRELVKLGMAAARGLESAVHSHTHRALELEVSPAAIEHAILLGVTTLGFPRMMAALNWVQAAVQVHHSGEPPRE